MGSGCRRCGGPVFRGVCLNCRPVAGCPACGGLGRVQGNACRPCRGFGERPVTSVWTEFEAAAAARALARALPGTAVAEATPTDGGGRTSSSRSGTARACISPHGPLRREASLFAPSASLSRQPGECRERRCG
jgi:hypothetical protein